MKKHISIYIVIATIGLFLLALPLGLAIAQRPIPVRDNPTGGESITSRSSYIPIQGRLTDNNGAPLTGSYSLTFRLYDVYTGGTSLCQDINPNVDVAEGLFSTYMNFQGCTALDGRQLYLGIQVGTDPEMTPRSYIDNVPYAWTLRPGANISGTIGGDAILDIDNYSGTGRGLRAEVLAASGENYAIIGASRSPAGYGGYFYNNGGGIGLYGQSDTGAAIVAGGSGVIQSAAQSYVWISGNGVHPYRQADTTVINMTNTGGARITHGGIAGGTQNVMLPVTVPGTLYGQNVTVTGLDIYFANNTDLDAITAILLRRQTGVCSTSACYVEILADFDDHVCDIGNNPKGCTLHYDLTTNNVLSADSGILYLTIELGFSGNTTWVDLGGIRLTLEHK